MSLTQLKKELNSLKNPLKAKIFQRFFKTGKGEYGEGDIFLGLTTPQCKILIKKYSNLNFSDIEKLLHSQIHEHRSIALGILVTQFETLQKQLKNVPSSLPSEVSTKFGDLSASKASGQTNPSADKKSQECIVVPSREGRMIQQNQAGCVASSREGRMIQQNQAGCVASSKNLLASEAKGQARSGRGDFNVPSREGLTDSPAGEKVRGVSSQLTQIYNFYLTNTKWINNWDLVDLSCYKIIGQYLLHKSEDDKKILYKLARSQNLWEKRISIISTYTFIKAKDFTDTLNISQILLLDKHDLIHKAVGWMLREIGKIDQKVEERFLMEHSRQMPRTMLRYAIEKFDEPKRQFYLKR